MISLGKKAKGITSSNPKVIRFSLRCCEHGVGLRLDQDSSSFISGEAWVSDFLLLAKTNAIEFIMCSLRSETLLDAREFDKP